MAQQSLICPNCGKDIRFDDSMGDLYCMYCGTPIDDTDRANSAPVAERTDSEDCEVTLYYTKPFWGQTPFAIVILDDVSELDLKNRCPVKVVLRKGEHKITVRSMKLLSLNGPGTEFMIDVRGDCSYEIGFIGTGNKASLKKAE